MKSLVIVFSLLLSSASSFAQPESQFKQTLSTARWCSTQYIDNIWLLGKRLYMLCDGVEVDIPKKFRLSFDEMMNFGFNDVRCESESCVYLRR